MALTLQNVIDIVYDCTEDGSRIAIIGNKQLADSIDVYLQDTDFMTNMGMLLECETPFFNRNDDYIIDINCTNGIYTYGIDYYKLNDKSKAHYDGLYVFSDKVIGKFDKNSIDSDLYKFYGYFSIRKEEIYHILDEIHGDSKVIDVPVDKEKEGKVPFDYFYNMIATMVANKADKVVKVEEEKPTITNKTCEVCCVECSDDDCEFQGDSEDCECDDCIQDRVDNCECDECNGNNKKLSWKTVDEECKCDECIKEDIVEKYLSSIDEVDGCEDCIENLLCDMFEEVKLIGWNAHKEYIDCCNDEDME